MATAESEQNLRKKIKQAEIEADIAFFDARLSLIGETPATAYAKAQQKFYLSLVEIFKKEKKKLAD